ncbi:MAG: SDR family NAD(P)-dependent oxidoreductase [Planctomycetes bacterium]|nr:SDR family NAD(P)-dependent oxidoreductase [Planctomycetota bacterium]
MTASTPALISTSTLLSSRKFALVTGAGSGLGRSFCLRLARDGWHVGVTDIDLAAAEKTLATLVAASGSGEALHLDVTDAFGWQNLLQQLQREWPQLDLLINNAGICGAGEIGEAPLEDFQTVFDVNFQGVLNGCHAMVPWMKETAPGGQIVNVASIFGLVAPPTMAAYNVSKAAVVALSETLYGELLPHGIGVTLVAPGFFASQLVARGRFATAEQQQDARRYVANAEISADKVVAQTLTAIERNKLYVVLGRRARWIWRLKRWLPSWFAKILVWKHNRNLRKIRAND